MRAGGVFVRVTRKRTFTSEGAGEALLRRAPSDPAPPKGVTARCSVSSERVDGFEVYRVSWGAADQSPMRTAVVYLHGGAYTNEIAPQHWSLITDLAQGTGLEVLVPLYGLAPDHDAREAHSLVAAVLSDLVAAGRTAYLVGDSAGGGLALAATQVAARETPGVVVGLTLVAPWLDLSLSNPEIAVVEPEDPWLARAGLRPIARAWAGDLSHDDPRVSPLFGDLVSLPPLDVWVGIRDITVTDSRVLRDRLPAGRNDSFTEEPGAIHVYPLLPVPEGRAARTAIVERIRTLTSGLTQG